MWVVIFLHATINAGDRTFEVIFPGLAEVDWQIPAYLAMLVASIVLAVLMRREGHKAAAVT